MEENKKQPKSRKWLYIVATILILGLVAVFAAPSLSGELFQGRSFAIKNPAIKTIPKAITPIAKVELEKVDLKKDEKVTPVHSVALEKDIQFEKKDTLNTKDFVLFNSSSADDIATCQSILPQHANMVNIDFTDWYLSNGYTPEYIQDCVEWDMEQKLEARCDDILAQHANIENIDFTAWLNANGYNMAQTNYCAINKWKTDRMACKMIQYNDRTMSDITFNDWANSQNYSTEYVEECLDRTCDYILAQKEGTNVPTRCYSFEEWMNMNDYDMFQVSTCESKRATECKEIRYHHKTILNDGFTDWYQDNGYTGNEVTECLQRTCSNIIEMHRYLNSFSFTSWLESEYYDYSEAEACVTNYVVNKCETIRNVYNYTSSTQEFSNWMEDYNYTTQDVQACLVQ